MMKLWARLFERLGLKRGAAVRSFELEESFQTSLIDLAEQEELPLEDLQADAMQAMLARRATRKELLRCWTSLSPREQDVTAFTCLDYTNRQISARLNISVDTVKTHIRSILIKFNVHSKAELKQALIRWDFSQWPK